MEITIFGQKLLLFEVFKNIYRDKSISKHFFKERGF